MRLDRRVLPALTFVTVFMASISLSTIALAKEADTEMPIGVPGGAVHADPFTGVATMSIPIEVPPGRHGVQPNLALTYSSSNGNGWVGMGWKLELGAIERQTRFGVDYSKDDYVIRLDAMSADLAPAPPPALSDEYRAKVEGGFLRVKHLANGGWELTDKKGTKYLFGTSSMSRMYDPGDSTRIFMWGLERVEDRDGNYMTVTYQTDGTTNQRYPDHIDYTGNGTLTPSGVVKFHLETRPDRATLMYTSKYPVRTERRLKSVTVWSDQSMSKLVRAYRLGYDLSYGSGASILVGVEQFGSDAIIDGTGAIINASSASKLPIVNFRYRQESQTFAQGVASLSGWCSGGSQFNASDFNGDGKQDLWCRNTSNGFSIAISDGVGTLTAGSNVFSGCSVQRVGDFNGDGKMDLGCVSWYEQPRNCGPIGGLTCEPLINWRASIATATDGLGTFSNPSNWLDPICGALPSYTPALGIGDFNGDGKQDLWCQIRGGTFAQVMVALSTGAAFQTSSNWISNWCIGSTPFGVGDVNGDGKTDVWCHGGGNTSVALSNGTNSFTGGNVWLSNWCGDGLPFGLADFNGDGLTDIWCHSGGNTSVALSNGTNAFVDGGVWRSGWCSNGVPSGGSDFNGDGKDDLWCYTSGGTIQIALSSSVVVPDVPSWLGIWCATGIFGVGDFTGDGKHDLFCQESGQVSIARSGSYPGAVDLLVIVSNGLTGTNTLSYTPSTQYSNTQLPYPLQTVSSITTCDNWVSATETCAGLSATTNYTYAGGYHHPAERDFRGFNYAKVTGPVGPAGEQAITETWFHQGNDVAVGANNPAAPNGYTKGLPYRSKVTDATGKVYSETTTTYVADADGVAPFFTPVAQVDTSIDNGAKQTRVVFPITSGYAPAYDIYGNVTMEYHCGDLATTSDDRSIYRVFGVNTTDWIVGLQTRESVYTGIGTASVNMVAQTDLYYDGTTSCATASVNQVPTKGHVTRTVRWLNGGTSPETRMAYDAFGNLTCTRDALGQTSTVTYDASNTFAKTATNPLGHVATTVYYGVDGVLMDKGLYGQVKSMTDPNNQTTTSEYDALGRKSKTTTPDGLITTATYNYGIGFTVGTQHVLTSTSGAGLATPLTNASYFDGLGRMVKKEGTGSDGKTIVTEVQYDSRGAVRKKSLPYFKTLESVTGRWATTSYDALGRVVRVDSPDSTRGLACFTDWVTVTVDAADHRKRETKDAYGRIVRVDEYQGTASICDTTVGTPYATTTYQYDVQGNLLAVTDAKGNISTMTYDTLGRKTAMHDPDMGNWSYLYL